MRLTSLSARYVYIVCLLSLTACASHPRLSYTPPVSINLSGDWILNENLSQAVVIVPKRPANKDRRDSPSGSVRGTAPELKKPVARAPNIEVEVPRTAEKTASMTSTSMKIEQDAGGMGIAYPKHPYWDIDWGQHEVRRAKVIAGWTSHNELVINHQSEKQHFVEVYRLDNTGKRLRITFTVDSINGKQDFVRVFDLRQ